MSNLVVRFRMEAADIVFLYATIVESRALRHPRANALYHTSSTVKGN